MALVSNTFFDSVKMIAVEKSIPEEDVYLAVEEALVKAAEKFFQGQDFYGNFQAQMDRETGEFHVYALKTVVQDVEEEDLEISLADDRAMSRPKSPYTSVATLKEYVLELTREA